MKCKLKNRDNIIENYLSGTLTIEEMETFDKHCFECQVCFRALQFREEMTVLIREEGPVLFSDYLNKSERKADNFFRTIIDNLSGILKAKPWKFAIAGMSFLVVLSGIFLFSPTPEKIINYDPVPYLEGMLTYESRGSNMQVLSPEIGKISNGPILFSWKPTEISPLLLSILNNQGEEMKLININKNQIQFRKKFKPGLYYWKLESEDDLLFIGKFIIK